MQKRGKTRPLRPKQEQEERPGREFKMRPKPQAEKPGHRGSGKLEGKAAIITGGDSGIGRAVAIAFAKEGADIVAFFNRPDRSGYADADVWFFGRLNKSLLKD